MFSPLRSLSLVPKHNVKRQVEGAYRAYTLNPVNRITEPAPLSA